MQAWLSRLAFSFAIIAAVLWWSAYQQSQVAGASAAVMIRVVAGGCAASMAIAGIRARHRRQS